MGFKKGRRNHGKNDVRGIKVFIVTDHNGHMLSAGTGSSDNTGEHEMN